LALSWKYSQPHSQRESPDSRAREGLYEATMRLLEKEYFVRDGKP
jgi:hypothetical protein